MERLTTKTSNHTALLERWKNRPAADSKLEASIRQHTPSLLDLTPKDVLVKGLGGFLDGASLILGNGVVWVAPIALAAAGSGLGIAGALVGAAAGTAAVVYTAFESAFPTREVNTRADLRESQADLVGDKLTPWVSKSFKVFQAGERQLLLNSDFGCARAVFEGADGQPVEIYSRDGVERDSPYNMFGQTKENFVPGFTVKAASADGKVYHLRNKGGECIVSGPGMPRTTFRILGNESKA